MEYRPAASDVGCRRVDTITVSFPDRAIGVDLEKIRSSILDLFWEGGADDV